MTTTNNKAAEDFFCQQATLDAVGFFSALQAAGYADLTTSPLAQFIYRGACSEGASTTAEGVTLSTLRDKLVILEEALAAFSQHAGPEGLRIDNHEGCINMGLSVLSPQVRSILQSDQKRADIFKPLMDEEAFARYDSNRDGIIDETEVSAFALTIRRLCDVYLEVAEDPELGLNVLSFNEALQRIGLPSLEKTLQGQFVNSVFERADLDGNNFINMPEWLRAGTRLEYPVVNESRIRACVGYPGWSALAMEPSLEQAREIAGLVSTLKTGDILLMRGGDDAMARYIKFSLNTPWTHVAVVVKRSPLGGMANEKTEEVLRKFPFRRASHHFCSPGYCRCFDLREEDFSPSRISGCSQVGMLESTGEGIHLYDLANRLFESQSKWTSIAIARLENVPDRDNVEKINSFIANVRGGIYTVAKNELKAAISFHSTSDAEEIKRPSQMLPAGNRSSDDFCASVVMRFYRHMGWVDDKRPCNSVMPSDFDLDTDSLSQFKHPVELLGRGTIGRVELIKSPELGVKLPLKLPKKKQ